MTVTAPSTGSSATTRPSPKSGPKRRRVEVPPIQQIEAVECGAACLAMVLGYYGRHESLESLRDVCGVSRDGSSLLDLLRAAKTFGLDCKGWRREPIQLRRLSLPMIAHWEFRHFVVIEGWAPGRWFINDPATGSRVITDAEFDGCFTGLVLTFAPTDDFTKAGKKPSTLRALRRHAAPIRQELLFLILVGLLLVVPTLAIPALLRGFTNNYLIASIPSVAIPLIIGLALSVAFQGLATWLQQQVAIRTHAMFRIRLTSSMVDHLLWLPGRFFTQRSSQEITRRVDMCSQVGALLSGPLTTAALGLVTAGVAALALLAADVGIAVLVLVSSGLVFLVLRLTTTAQHRLAQREMGELSDLVIDTGSTIALFESVKVSGQEDGVFDRISARLLALTETRNRQNAATAWQSAVPVVLITLTQVVVLIVAAFRVMNGEFTIGGLVAVQFLTRTLLMPVAALVPLKIQVEQLAGALDRISDVMDTSCVRRDDTAEIALVHGNVSLRAVTFGYRQQDDPLIRDFSMDIPPGRRIALVGSSGSGKSTIAKLIVGLYQPWTGEVLIDDRPISDWPSDSLAESVSWVGQDVALFAGTIRDNVTLWNDAIPDEAISRALIDAQVRDELAGRPGGLEFKLGESGQGLSGGQKQRLGIARALATDPRILVMDEATAALDPLTEAAIEQAVKARGCTVVTIAHRLSTVRDADEIVVLDKGIVVERGTHAELFEAGGKYRELCDE